MNNISYVDSSALVKLYISELGSSWMETNMDMAEHPIAIADIGRAEVMATFAGKLRGKLISSEGHQKIFAKFNKDVQSHYRIIPVTSDRVDEAIELIQHSKLRGYDAVHLACALWLQKSLMTHGLGPLIFVAADKDLLAAAQSAGLATENPNDYG